ncbi:MAG TPA: glycosyltransferase family 2 protein [Burkholderiaceae bacterium]|nr:glycosyltransferase family 2 protein [Burkholderiaceae bacterium]
MNSSDFDVTAIVVSYNTRDLIPACLSALRTSAATLRLQIIVIDNGSRDDSVAALRGPEYADCEVIVNPTNVGFGRANNQALALARGRHVLLLNTDAFVAADSLTKTVQYLDAHPRCGLLGVRLVGRDGVLQPSCRYFPTPWNEFLLGTGWARYFPGSRLIDDMGWDHASVRECDWVPGCYYLVRRQAIDEVGLFDPRFFLYYEEVDHCRALKAAGWTVVYFPDTTVVHLGGESAKTDAPISGAGRQISALQIESALLYYRKHHGLAGMWASVALTWLADMIMTAKWLVRRRTWQGAGAFWNHAVLTGSLLLRTGWARRPTR